MLYVVEPLLTIKEVARYLKLDPQTVSRKAQRGDLPGVRIGNRWRFKKEEIERSLKKSGDPLAGLLRYLPTRPEVKLVYLFGSTARGEDQKGSDTDLAVLLAKGLDPLMKDQILAEIGARVAGRADLVSLDEAPPLLKYEVVSDGRIIHQTISQEEVAMFELGIYREYFHMERIRRLQFEALGA